MYFLSFISSLKILPAGQCLSLIELLTTELKEYYLPLLDQLMLTTSLQKKKRRNSFYLSQKTDSLISSVSHVIDVMETVLLPLPLDVFGKGRHCEEIVGVVCMLIKDVCLPYMDIAKEKVRCNEMKLDHLIKNHRTHPSILGSLVIGVLICVKLNHCHTHF